jgi:GNAT superfamily N-acetyltransferase
MTNSWLRFTWDLKPLPTSEIIIPSSYILRAVEKEEAAIIQKVTASAFSMDPGWGNIQKPVIEKICASASLPFEKESKSRCIVLQHGSRIIGSSVLNTEEDSENHLASGPCILHEYRSRGLGSLLLQASLRALAATGLNRACGVTRDKTTAARFVYPKFGGQASPCTPDWQIPTKIAA